LGQLPQPWLWIGLAVVCFHEMRTRFGRAMLLAIYGLSLAVSLASKMVPLGAILGLLAVGIGFLRLGYWFRADRRIWPGCLSIVMIYGIFGFCKRQAEAIFQKQLGSQFQALQILDVSIWPAPANPFCWTALAAMRHGNDYISAKAVIGPLFQVGHPSLCSIPFKETGLASFTPIVGADTKDLRWIGSTTMGLADLNDLKKNCEFDSLMRFSRMPFWTDRWFGDLRYDQGNVAGFATIDRSLYDSKTCPKYSPHWNPPRQDLF